MERKSVRLACVFAAAEARLPVHGHDEQVRFTSGGLAPFTHEPLQVCRKPRCDTSPATCPRPAGSRLPAATCQWSLKRCLTVQTTQGLVFFSAGLVSSVSFCTVGFYG